MIWIFNWADHVALCWRDFEKFSCSAEIETVSEKCKNLKTHLKAVRDELNNNLSMRQMRQNEVNTEKVKALESNLPPPLMVLEIKFIF